MRVAELRQELTVLLRASDPDFVFFLEARGRGLFLRAAPIDVSRIVREEVVDHFKATVLTSATLAVDGGFDYVRGRLGIRARRGGAAALGVRLLAAGHSLPAAAHAAAS